MYRDTVWHDFKMFAFNRSVVFLLKAHILTSEMYNALWKIIHSITFKETQGKPIGTIKTI